MKGQVGEIVVVLVLVLEEKPSTTTRTRTTKMGFLPAASSRPPL
jgi:hypothetical protein